MLRQQRLDFAAREVPEPQGLGANVEGAATGDDGVFGGRPDAVVAHVAHAAQDHALWKAARAVRVAGAQLPQHCQQSVADQRVYLVDHQHQRPGVRLGPAGKGSPESLVRAKRLEGVETYLSQGRVA